MIFIVKILYAQSEITIELNIAKETYLHGELVDLGVSINTEVLSNNDNKLRLDLFKESIRVSTDYSRYDHLLLNGDVKNDNMIYKIIELNGFFGERYSPMTIGKLLPVGKYTIEVYIENNKIIKNKTSISFEIIPSKNDVLSTWNEYQRILSNLSKGVYPPLAAGEALSDLIKNRPSSVYAPLIISYTSALYNTFMADTNKSEELLDQLVEKYSWSSRSLGKMKKNLKTYSTPEDKKQYLNRIRSSVHSPMDVVFDVILRTEIIAD